MKTLQFFYESTAIHFLVNPTENDVMINATEMAKLFGKRTGNYLRNDETQNLIKRLKQTQKRVQIDDENKSKSTHMSVQINPKIIEDRGRNGIYFCEILAIDFATWLDIDFKIWVYQSIQNVIFGNYRKHWEAHVKQEQLKQEIAKMKAELIKNGASPDELEEYFLLEQQLEQTKRDKSKAIRNQLKLFDTE